MTLYSGTVGDYCLRQPWNLVHEKHMNTIAAGLKNRIGAIFRVVVSHILVVASCALFVLVHNPATGLATDYYVDSINGDDSFTGLDETHPWRSLQKVYTESQNFQAGDTVNLKRGSAWGGAAGPGYITAALALDPQCHGTLGNYITIQDYGTGNKPRVFMNGLSCGIYLNQDFIKVRNVEVTYDGSSISAIFFLLLDDSDNSVETGNSQHSIGPGELMLRSFSPASALPPSSLKTSSPSPIPTVGVEGVTGKGIRIEGGSNQQLPYGEFSIVIDSCDVNKCPTSGISIWNRGYVKITGGDALDSEIRENQQNGIEVFDNSEGQIKYITITKCKIRDNQWNGIYLAGDYATIVGNEIERNAHLQAPDSNHELRITGNVYLWGNNATVSSNVFKGALIGSGFRYSGSNLNLGPDNRIVDNHTFGIGLWNNDPGSSSDNNNIFGNTIRVKDYNIGVNNMAISIGYDTETGAKFTNTYIHDNTITGDNDADKRAGGIDIQPCQFLQIYNNTFSGNSVGDRLTGPLIQIDRSQWTMPDLNADFIHNNIYYVNLPNLDTSAFFWFYDGLYAQHDSYSWLEWTSSVSEGGLGRDNGSQLRQGQAD